MAATATSISNTASVSFHNETTTTRLDPRSRHPHVNTRVLADKSSATVADEITGRMC